MRKFLFVLFLLIGALAIYINREQIIKTIINNVIESKEVNLEYKNSYYLKYNFKYVDELENFKIKNKEDLINLYYTVINNGNEIFEFYCPEEYKNCINDVTEIANNPKELSVINGFVHPYNSFDTVETVYNSLGQVTLTIKKTYNYNDIVRLNEKIDEIVKNQVKNEKNTKKIIKIIHDYIIEHTKYDKERSDHNIIKYQSNTAIGVFFEGYGICSGYADAMALFLNYYDIPNYKVASENHVWNAVYIDGKWLHLDLTWDDPIISTGEDILDDSYFLITTEQLKKLEDSQHHFDETVYQELVNK
ncbi:MAG: hypothetical protein IJ568_02240 [Bacilli bacterium]|nr:hypothetical protein [Bacilli bacterium]